MLISVITVCKNSGKTIGRTIKSVREQFKTNSSKCGLEYIVVDGGSTDNTVDIIQSNKDIITKYVSEPDKGIFDAMNKGWQMATGQFIMFLNSDDYFANEALKSIIDFTLIAKDKHIQILTGTTIIFSQKRVGKHNYLNLIRFGIKELKRHNSFPHPSTLVSRKLIKQLGGFNDKILISSDYDFFVRVVKKNNIKILAVNDDWVFMDENGASSQYKSFRTFIKIELELFYIQIKNYNFAIAFCSSILRLFSHLKYFLGKF